MRRIVRSGLKSRLETLLVHMPPPVSARHRVVVLCYHSVHPTEQFANRTSPDLFDRHMSWLRGNCNVIPFDELVNGSRMSDRTRPTVAVTFDDGFADSYTEALPILVRQEIPATFFIATGLVERVPAVLRARSWRGWRAEGSTLTWDQIVEIRRAGMAIGGHGHTHRTLAQIEDEEVIADLLRCRELLEERVGEQVKSLAYPKGRPRRDYTRRTVALARKAGYERAGAVLLRGLKETDDDMEIPRFPIAADPLETLRAKVEGRLDLLGVLQERVPPSMFRMFGY
jgi:peptidoglycan/xylan/chitin deacetylase (PgdA/CDA1 family)